MRTGVVRVGLKTALAGADIFGQLQGSAPSAWSVSPLLVAGRAIGSGFGAAAC